MTERRSSRAFIPLDARLAAIFAIGVFVFGSSALYLIGAYAYRNLEAEQSKRLEIVADFVARRAEEPILLEDWIALDKLLQDTVELDPDLAYAIVTDERSRVLGDSFPAPPPEWARPILTGERDPAKRNAGEPPRVFTEATSRIMDGRLGRVRIGIDRQILRDEVGRLVSVFSALVAAYLLVGALLTILVARRITRPVASIIRAMDAFQLDGPPVSLTVETNDEMELLAERVVGMTERLRQFYASERSRDEELARVEKLAAIGSLTASLAHELKNPLAGIKSASQRLAGGNVQPDRSTEYAMVIEEAANRMERSLRRVLDFAVVREPVVQDVELSRCLRAALELAAPMLERCRVESRLPAADALVRADCDLLVQALLNIVLNAAYAVEEVEEPWIRVEALEEEAQVQIRIVDGGSGIDAAVRGRIFDPFFTTRATKGGTGLGLSSSWSAIRSMGGELTLDTEALHTTFVIRLEKARPKHA